jgi:hypothetical protein
MQRLVFLFILGSLLELSGFAALFVLGQVTTLTCERVEPTQVTCTVERTWLNLLDLGEAERITVIAGEPTDEATITPRAMRAMDDFAQGTAPDMTQTLPPLGQAAALALGGGLPLILGGSAVTILTVRRLQQSG